MFSFVMNQFSVWLSSNKKNKNYILKFLIKSDEILKMPKNTIQ